MFNYEEYIKVKSSLPFSAVIDRVRDALEEVGEASVYEDGEIVIRSRSFQSFAWEMKVTGWIKERSDRGDYAITITYTINPQVIAIILGVLFIPVGAILVVMGLNAKQEVQRKLQRALRDIEDALETRA